MNQQEKEAYWNEHIPKLLQRIYDDALRGRFASPDVFNPDDIQHLIDVEPPWEMIREVCQGPPTEDMTGLTVFPPIKGGSDYPSVEFFLHPKGILLRVTTQYTSDQCMFCYYEETQNHWYKSLTHPSRWSYKFNGGAFALDIFASGPATQPQLSNSRTTYGDVARYGYELRCRLEELLGTLKTQQV